MRSAAAEKWRDEDCLSGAGWAQEETSRPADWYTTRKPRRLTVAPNCPASPEDIAQRGHAGLPLQRSADLMALAGEVVSRRESVEFSDEWIETLAADFAQFDD